MDGEDWVRGVTPSEIIHNVLVSRDSGNVVLLHDGGGDRRATVAALGPLIDTLRARGDTIVLEPANPADREIEIYAGSDFGVLGVVCGVFRPSQINETSGAPLPS